MKLSWPIYGAAPLLIFAGLFAPPAAKPLAGAELLEQQLLREGAASLAEAARRQGDAQRGAITFHQRNLACAVCHLPDEDRRPIGPDLAKPQEAATDVYLVESVLQPSKSVRKGYESIQVVTSDGRTIAGLMAEDRPDRLVLRSTTGDFGLIAIAKDEIDERQVGRLSLMPGGLVNQLASREQFLDLMRYVLEVAEYGPQRAAQLRPPPGLYAEAPLPEYERRVDHADLISDWNDDGFRRGEAIYGRVCANCHGTHDRPGSLPTSLRFASDKFKNGSDPYSLYRTLTHGFGLMAPQRWMVPREKYDVIHYLREAYLKTHNPTQYAPIDAAYLAGLPPGDTRGPEPNALRPWVAMNYGPSLVNTYEIGSDGSNFAYKAVAIRLDGGPGGVSRGRRWMIFEHDTLRMAAAWSARPEKDRTTFIDYNGIHFNGRHQVHPRIVGRLHLASRGLGWGDPETGQFADVRLRGRDNKPYGPLPRSWGRFKGFYRHGDRVVLSYSVGETDILEMPGAVERGKENAPLAFTRTFQIGPRASDLVLHVADHPVGKAKLRVVRREPDGGGRIAIVEPDRAALASEAAGLAFDGKTSLEAARPEDFDLSGGDYTIAARIRTAQGGTIFCQTRPGDRWAPGGKALFVRGGRLCFDVGWVGVVESRRKVGDGRWHDVAVVWRQKTGEVRLWIDGRPDRQGVLRPGEPLKSSVVRLGFGAPNFPQPQSYFRGEIAEVRFWNRVLADEELTRPAAPAPADKSLIACWRFDAADEGAVPDVATKRHGAAIIRSADVADADGVLSAGLSPEASQAKWAVKGGQLRLRLPAGDETLRFTLWMSDGDVEFAGAPLDFPSVDLSRLTHGGPARWPQTLETRGVLGPDDGPFAVDVLPLPVDNPWSCRFRLTGFEFFDRGRAAAVCTWDGDVWQVRGIDRPEQGLAWRRIASGLFQPLGLKVVDGKIYVGCRDQIVVLHDQNGDGETDFYETFNSDHQVTEHFHEFAMGLQTDAAGNFYYAKSARHALPAVVPHHGTLLRVSPDGRRTDILATGFRAANGVCLNPDGTFFVTDQEGHWTPKNRINWVKPGGFYGNMLGYHDVTDADDEHMQQPLCWITNSFDRSPGELLWVPRDAWGPLAGSLLELSYGAGKIFIVPHEKAEGGVQGGMCALPLPIFPTGLMRGRFHPSSGQLYACGMFAWGGNQTAPGGFYRVRYTGKPVYVPIKLHARRDGVEIKFSGPLDPALATDPARYGVRTWSIKRSANYGSAHHDERPLRIASASLAADGRSVFLELPDLEPTWCMSIEYRLKAADGAPAVGEVNNTIHRLLPRGE